MRKLLLGEGDDIDGVEERLSVVFLFEPGERLFEY